MINVLIVEDSSAMQMMLRNILESDPGIRVAAAVGSGEEALRYLARDSQRVDIVTMDIVMPGMDGFTATRSIMETTPLPIVVVSAAYKPGEAENSFKAIDAGAVAIIEKPVISTHPDYPRISVEMIETVKVMSEVKVVTRFARRRPFKSLTDTDFAILAGGGEDHCGDIEPKLVVMGASTGGPPVVRQVLAQLPPGFPAPILVAQHIKTGFLDGMAKWLDSGISLPVRVPMAGEPCLPGHVYLAPDNVQMGISSGKRILLERDGPETAHQPSVNHLFRSAARYCAPETVAILFSGMGDDGAHALKELKDNGAMTIAQDEASCVVFGMPGEAVKLGAACHVLPPEGIAALLVRLSRKKQ